MVFYGIKWDNMGIYGRLLIFHGGVKAFYSGTNLGKRKWPDGVNHLAIINFITNLGACCPRLIY
jgi:hypothetical protein